MRLRARQKVILSAVGAAVAVAGASSLAVAQAAPGAGDASAQQVSSSSDTPPFAVEDFAYPGADKVYKEKGIKLHRGDGHIVLTECTPDSDIRVDSRAGKESKKGYCFKVTGKRGYLTLEIPETYIVWAEEHPVHATITTDGKTKKVTIPKNDMKAVGESDVPSGSQKAVLVELRVAD